MPKAEFKTKKLSNLQRRAYRWIVGNDTGHSSINIWSVMMGIEAPSKFAPYDRGDLGRCIRLINLIPEWRGEIERMCWISPTWFYIASNWDQIEKRWAKNDFETCLRILKTAHSL